MNLSRTLVTFCVASAVLGGCQQPDLRREVLGTWDCTDPFRIGATDTAKITVVFKDDGKCISYETSHDGTRHWETTNGYHIVGDRLWWYHQKLTTVYHLRLRSDGLTWTIDRSINEEDVGKKMRFRRRTSESGVPSVR